MNFPYHAYLAGPFFTPEQTYNMDAAKSICQEARLIVFDPREHGPRLGDVAPQDRTPELLDAILKANVDGILSSYMMIACIDDRDTGTAWELGYAHCSDIRTITFSARGFGANVMIARSVHGHLHSLLDLSAYLNRPEVNNAILMQTDSNLPPINSAAEAID